MNCATRTKIYGVEFSEVEAAEISTPFGQSNLGHSTVPLSTLVNLLDWESAVFRSPILLGVLPVRLYAFLFAQHKLGHLSLL